MLLPVGESNFTNDTPAGSLYGIKEVKWEIPSFDRKTTSWRYVETLFIVAMRRLRLDSVLGGNREEMPVADRMIPRERLNARYRAAKTQNILLYSASFLTHGGTMRTNECISVPNH